MSLPCMMMLSLLARALVAESHATCKSEQI